MPERDLNDDGDAFEHPISKAGRKMGIERKTSEKWTPIFSPVDEPLRS